MYAKINDVLQTTRSRPPVDNSNRAHQMWSTLATYDGMEATTGDGDNIIVELKHDKPRTIYFNCNINFIKLLYDVTFLMSPKCILPPVAIYSTRRRLPAKSPLQRY